MGNSLVRASINRLFGCEIKDIMTGFRAFSYGFVKTFPVLSKGFEIETEMTIHGVYNHMQIENVVVEYRDRPEGSESKLNTYSDGFKVLGMIFRLYRDYKPFGFFSILALVLAAAAVLFLYSGAVGVFCNRTGSEIPDADCLWLCYDGGDSVFFAGLILSNMALKNRRDFEYRLTLVCEKEERKRGQYN